MTLKTALIGWGLIATGMFILVPKAEAQGYTGFELQHTQVYDRDYTSGVTVFRRYQDGLFVDAELFNDGDAYLGAGYQYGDQNTLLDIRVNEQNVKVFIMQRF